MTEAGAQEAVLTERRDRMLLVTLNRPDQRNAINAAVACPGVSISGTIVICRAAA